MPDTAEATRSRVVRQASPPRPSSTAVLLVPAAIALDLLGRNIHSRLLTLAAAALLGAIVAALSMTPWIQGLQVDWLIPTRLTVGAETVVNLTFLAPDRRAWRGSPVEFSLEHPALEIAGGLIPALGRGQTAQVQLRVRPTHRGSWEPSGHIVIEVRSPLGGFSHRRKLPLDVALIVHPEAARPITSATDKAGTGDGSRLILRSDPAGTELLGLRDWRPGDPASTVHWRASARRDRLAVIEREPPVQAQLTVVIGATDFGDGWEQAVARIAATGVQAAQAGGRVVVVTADGAAELRRVVDVLDCFAAIDLAGPASAAQVNAAVPSAGRGGTVLWLSADEPSPDIQAVLGQAGRAVWA